MIQLSPKVTNDSFNLPNSGSDLLPKMTYLSPKVTNESSILPNSGLDILPKMTNELANLPNKRYGSNKQHNSLQLRELNCNSLPQPRPSGIISNVSIEHNTTDLGSRILHRSNKPDSLTEIPSIPNQNKRKHSEFPFPAASPTFPNNVDKKIVSHFPKNTTRSNTKHSSSNRCPNQPNKITEYFMRYKQ